MAHSISNIAHALASIHKDGGRYQYELKDIPGYEGLASSDLLDLMKLMRDSHNLIMFTFGMQTTPSFAVCTKEELEEDGAKFFSAGELDDIIKESDNDPGLAAQRLAVIMGKGN